MAKTKYQQAAMDYAKEYTDKLLDIEDYVGRNLLQRNISRLVRQEVEQLVKGEKPA